MYYLHVHFYVYNRVSTYWPSPCGTLFLETNDELMYRRNYNQACTFIPNSMHCKEFCTILSGIYII